MTPGQMRKEAREWSAEIPLLQGDAVPPVVFRESWLMLAELCERLDRIAEALEKGR